SLLLHVWLIDSESARKPMTSAPCTTRLRRAGAVRVVLHVVIRRKKVSNLDAATGCVRTFEQKSIVSAFSGRNSSEFGTVRPRVQIPGPRPILGYGDPNIYAYSHAPTPDIGTNHGRSRTRR